jgi:hypothetical protein
MSDKEKLRVMSIPVEYASQRKVRTRNKLYYRFNHWPIWIFVFFIAPGPLTFELFEHGFDYRIVLWLSAVTVLTGVAGLAGRLPGTEARPLIVRFVEDCPNPIHRKICYTVAWSELVTFTALNAAGLVVAVVTGTWYLREIYRMGYFPLAALIGMIGAFGYLPRAKPSTRGEGYERRYFYGAVWAVAAAHPVLWLVWKVLPQTRGFDLVKLLVFVGILGGVGVLAWFGRLPRTRPIVSDEFAISA